MGRPEGRGLCGHNVLPEPLRQAAFGRLPPGRGWRQVSRILADRVRQGLTPGAPPPPRPHRDRRRRAGRPGRDRLVRAASSGPGTAGGSPTPTFSAGRSWHRLIPHRSSLGERTLLSWIAGGHLKGRRRRGRPERHGLAVGKTTYHSIKAARRARFSTSCPGRPGGGPAPLRCHRVAAACRSRTEPQNPDRV